MAKRLSDIERIDITEMSYCLLEKYECDNEADLYAISNEIVEHIGNGIADYCEEHDMRYPDIDCI